MSKTEMLSSMESGIASTDINRVLLLVKTIAPDNAPLQLNLLCYALVVGAKSMDVPEEEVADHISEAWKQMEGIALGPIVRPS